MLGRYVLADLRRHRQQGGKVNGHWAPVWLVCPVCLLHFTVYARSLELPTGLREVITLTLQAGEH